MRDIMQGRFWDAIVLIIIIILVCVFSLIFE
jgi:hypothetical protein